MSSVVQNPVPALWATVVSIVQEGLVSQQPGVEFFGSTDQDPHRTNKAVVSLARTVAFARTAVHQLQATMTVQFGCMVRSGDRPQGKHNAEDLSYWLADLLMADPFLGGVSTDARVESIEFDADVAGEEDPAEWVVVTAAWDIRFSRP